MSETYPQLTSRPSINPLRLVSGVIYFLVAIGSLFNTELLHIQWSYQYADFVSLETKLFIFHHSFALVAIPVGAVALGLIAILTKKRGLLLWSSVAYFLLIAPVSWILQFLAKETIPFAWGINFLDTQFSWQDSPISYLMIAVFTLALVLGIVAALTTSERTPSLSSDYQAGVNQVYTQTTQQAAPGTFPSNLPIFALVGAFIFPIVGVVLGHISLSQMKRGQIVSDNRGLALAGMVIGYVFIGLSFIFGIILIVALVINASRTSYY
jgi:hypothetical protein